MRRRSCWASVEAVGEKAGLRDQMHDRRGDGRAARPDRRAVKLYVATDPGERHEESIDELARS